MTCCKILATVLAVCLAIATIDGLSSAEPEARGTLWVTTSAGKDQKLTSWKFVAGTRRLAWLAKDAPPEKKDDTEDAPPTKKGKAKGPAPRAEVGPEALVFREDNSTNFVDGIETLVLLEHLRSITYDDEKKTATVRIAVGEKDDANVEITGTTRYKDINKVSIEAESDLGDLGIAKVKFHGGIPKGGVRGLAFSGAKPAPEVKGRLATITVNDKGKDKNIQKVTDLQPLYRLEDGSSRLVPLLMFKKTVKLDPAKLQKMALVTDKDRRELEWQLTLKDGQELTLTLLAAAEFDGKKAALEGLVGRVPGGYKLYHVDNVAEVVFDEVKDPPKE